MIKHISLKMKTALLYLANLCLKKGDIPNDWRLAQIYFIPKSYDWEYDITKTRPITLLDTVRKLIIKIITKCLSRILANHKVLHGNNFAGLPDGSYDTPIKILNNILED